MIRYLVLFLALVFSTQAVVADSRSEAKARYQAGVKAYNAGDYKVAIREFSAAQEIFPADLNNYNLALCYDKLGDPEPAIQYYRAFLDKQPNSDKKAEIEASIKRLDAAAKSAATKREAAAREEEARRAAEARKAEEDAREAEEARAKEEARRPATPDVRPSTPDLGPEVGNGVGSTGTPGGGGTVSTGDSQLDRVARIDVNAIRDQRVGGQSSGMVAPQPGGPTNAPTGDPNNAAANIDVGAHAGSTAGPAISNNATPAVAGQQPQGTPDPADTTPKGKPVYKKWWFWAVVIVSAYVVYSIATEDSNSDNVSRVLPPMGTNSNSAAVGSGGMTLMRW